VLNSRNSRKATTVELSAVLNTELCGAGELLSKGNIDAEGAFLRELFKTGLRPSLPENNRHFLKIDGYAISVQVAITDEIERYGVQFLLKSRGAKVLDFDVSEDSPSTFETDRINSNADVIVLSDERWDSGQSTELPAQIINVAEASPESKILVISRLRGERAVSLALSARVSQNSRLLIRTDRINVSELVNGVRDLGLDIQKEVRISLPSTERPDDILMNAVDRVATLTTREHEVLGYIAKGCSNRQIAEDSGISLRTVNNHAGRLFLKLGINANGNVNARVTASLAFCIFHHVLINTPEATSVTSNAAEKSIQGTHELSAQTL
jgi:DNA-binding NarL/FixJ family response regulator